eukprot:TRINITY_DN383_c0_g1_i1.p1 TRINITY_DN383_c0_g1~~TRINITY_DN383_c0_g1_i1.p1  ORF type:complete len:161 (-),score=49.87 TRINITY_DN383_c0_g1_i1:102-584(-)
MMSIQSLLNPMSEKEEQEMFQKKYQVISFLNNNSQKINMNKRKLNEMSYTQKITINNNEKKRIERRVELSFNNSQVENLVRIDITDLLSLPQKIAAAKLGISESMLCKKFKETTNRKWPYRYLQKLERDLADCTTNEEINELENKKKEFLSPVSIYIKRG